MMDQKLLGSIDKQRQQAKASRSLLTLVACCLIQLSLSHLTVVAGIELEEPFDLPFGPDYGDTFIRRADGHTTEPFGLGGIINYGNNTFDLIRFSVNGRLYLDSDGYGNYFYYNDIELMRRDLDTVDELFGEMCLNYKHYYIDLGYYAGDTCEFWYQYSSVPGASMSLDLSQSSVKASYLSLAVAEWNAIYFYYNEIDLHFDDELQLLVAGPGTTKYPNLSNNFMVRNLTSTDKPIVNNLLNSQGGDFDATFGYVISLYKAQLDDGKYGKYDSGQFVLACDEKGTPGIVDDNKCYVLFQFVELNDDEDVDWSFEFDDGDYSELELPYSDTMEYPKILDRSNCGIPGRWIYEIRQTLTEPYIGGPPGGMATYCPNATLLPRVVPLFPGPGVNLRVSDCTGFAQYPDGSVFIVQLRGSVTMNLTATYENNDHWALDTNLPEMWGFEEEVEVLVIVDDTIIETTGQTIFFKALTDQTLHIEYQESSADISWPGYTVSSPVSLHLHGYEQPDASMGYVLVENQTITVNSGVDSYSYSFTSAHLISVELQTTDGTRRGLVVKPDQTDCESVEALEASRNLSACEQVLLDHWGCPSSKDKRPAAFWALEEIYNGTRGWFFDPCCNQYSTDTSSAASSLGLCDRESCEFNTGADFCILSPVVGCQDDQGKKHYVTNQCCYDSAENLITNTSRGAGRMGLQPATIGNTHQRYIRELEPLNKCCPNVDTCDFINEYRPTIAGTYKPSLTVNAKFLGHFNTIDGLDYFFFGRGVFTFLETTLPDKTTVQISTRPVGLASAISGFVVSHKESKFEFYVPDVVNYVGDIYRLNGINLYFVLMRQPLNETCSFAFGGILFERDEGGASFQVTVQATGLKIRAYVVGLLVNLFVTVPPEFEGVTQGLVGNYDGDDSNDHMAADTILTFNTPLDDTMRHVTLASVWEVPQEKWLFGYMSSGLIRGQLNAASSKFNYSVPDNAYDLYRSDCDADETCIRYVYWAGETTIADYYRLFLEADIPGKNVETLNELVRLLLKSTAAGNHVHVFKFVLVAFMSASAKWFYI